MKKAVLLILTFVMASCAKDPTIVGRWKVKKINIENQMLANMMMGYTQQAIGKTFEFNADGTVTSEGNESENVNGQMHYTVDGNNISIDLDVDMTMDSLSIDTTMNISGTYELPDKTSMKMKLAIELPESHSNLMLIKFSIEAERQ